MGKENYLDRVHNSNTFKNIKEICLNRNKEEKQKMEEDQKTEIKNILQDLKSKDEQSYRSITSALNRHSDNLLKIQKPNVEKDMSIDKIYEKIVDAGAILHTKKAELRTELEIINANFAEDNKLSNKDIDNLLIEALHRFTDKKLTELKKQNGGGFEELFVYHPFFTNEEEKGKEVVRATLLGGLIAFPLNLVAVGVGAGLGVTAFAICIGLLPVYVAGKIGEVVLDDLHKFASSFARIPENMRRMKRYKKEIAEEKRNKKQNEEENQNGEEKENQNGEEKGGPDISNFLKEAMMKGKKITEDKYPDIVKDANQSLDSGAILKTSVDPNEKHSLAYYERKLHEGKAGGKRRTRKANKAKKRSTKKAKKSAKRKARKSRR